MANNKYLMLDLNDDRSGKVAEVMANKTCKKILGLIADQELSETDISLKLKMPANTVNYNIKKLLETGLIEKASNFFWSVKGKKINLYRVSNKKIIISPKKSFGFLASAILGGLFLGLSKLGLNYFGKTGASEFIGNNSYDGSQILTASTNSIVKEYVGETGKSFMNLNYFQNVWIWVVIGLILGILSYFLYKKLKGGSIN